MTHEVPGGVEQVGSTIHNPNGPHFGECSELGAGPGAALKPDKERDLFRGSHNIVSGGSEEIIEHATLAFGMIPIDFLITCVM